MFKSQPGRVYIQYARTYGESNKFEKKGKNSCAVSIECAGEISVNKLLPKENEPPRKGML